MWNTKLSYGQLPFQEEEQGGLPPGAAMTAGGALGATGSLAYLRKTRGLKRDPDAKVLSSVLMDRGMDAADAAKDAKAMRGAAMKGRYLAGGGFTAGLGATMYGMGKLHDHLNKTSSYDAGFDLVLKTAKLDVVKAVKAVKPPKAPKIPKLNDKALDTAVGAATAIPVGAAGLYMSSGK